MISRHAVRKLLEPMPSFRRHIEVIYSFLRSYYCLASGQPFYGTHFFINDEKQFAYFPIYKAASSSIKESINGEKTFFSNAPSRLSEKHHVFTFVRNPFDRLASCYKDKFSGASPHYFRAFNARRWPFRQIVFGENESFDAFVKKVCAIPDHKSDIHFVSQHALLSDSGKILPDSIYQFENLSTIYPKLQEKYGLLELPHKNNKNSRNWRSLYDEELISAVRERYREDFEMWYPSFLQKEPSTILER
jgi:hypothetical protein